MSEFSFLMSFKGSGGTPVKVGVGYFHLTVLQRVTFGSNLPLKLELKPEIVKAFGECMNFDLIVRKLGRGLDTDDIPENWQLSAWGKAVLDYSVSGEVGGVLSLPANNPPL